MSRITLCGDGRTHAGHGVCPGIPTDLWYEVRLTSWPPPDIRPVILADAWQAGYEAGMSDMMDVAGDGYRTTVTRNPHRHRAR